MMKIMREADMKGEERKKKIKNWRDAYNKSTLPIFVEI